MLCNGIDLRDFYTGRLSLRRLKVLVFRLISMHGQSALSVAFLGEAATWSNAEYMLADLRDSIESGNYMFLSAHRSDDYRMPDFRPYPRPGVDWDETMYELTPEPEWASAEDIAQLFDYMHGG